MYKDMLLAEQDLPRLLVIVKSSSALSLSSIRLNIMHGSILEGDDPSTDA